MTGVDTAAAAAMLEAALRERGVPTVPGTPEQVMFADLAVFVGRFTGMYRWYEGDQPREHPVSDVGGAAAEIAATHRTLQAIRPGAPLTVTVGGP